MVAQRISAETSSKVQLQLVLHTGAHINFHFTGSGALEERQRVKEHLARALSKASPVHISAELEAKNSLLKSNPSLYQLYKDLVTTGLITPEEFWASQSLDKKRGESAESAQGQESGLPSAFLVSKVIMNRKQCVGVCVFRLMSRQFMMVAMLSSTT